MALELNGTTGVSLVQDGVVTAADLAAGAITASALPSGTIVQAKWAQQASGNVEVVHSGSATGGLYGFPNNRVYGDLVNVSITPLSASNRLVFMCHAGMTSFNSWVTNTSFGLAFVKDNTTGYETVDYPWYSAGGTFPSNAGAYPPDQHFQYTLNAGSTSSQTFYLKGFAYSEGNSISCRFRAATIIILEVAA